jgi:tetratricopeptide (TPR) repeat protein
VVASGRVAAGGVLPEAAVTVVGLLTAAVGDADYDRPGRAGEWLWLVPHVLAVLGARGRLPGEGEADLAGCASGLSLALARAGSYPAALEVAAAGLERDSGLAADHPAVLMLRFRRASAWRFLGRAADAEAEFRQVLDARLRVQGPDHPSALAARHGLAAAVAAQGRAADAEAEYRHVLDAKTRVLGPDHPDTLTTRHGLAYAVAGQGRAADAEAGYRQVLDARLRVLGPDHPDTLATCNALEQIQQAGP